ncbi:uncharacterized protein LACBIDRAFT_303584 [Laccaria bicolor S238N-H82]|uniref:Predicted protein n=1 Tax=Laccaria bicolor (strain S238N-H82 / ATCC MYA-4686) TaxID=486041 RepID=B0DJS3_LACBS|nr:uncharacterized protein LACBIDRAFT_303584 [Laccaria bicolor S238N-H82]EDR05167.1 predicted protein [Laccaria bicolor S238N-H82]|eukprot:XP_001884132.1 predicted protein [Laccaria bicolor S238N-H82]
MHAMKIRLRSSSGRERMRERRPLHFLMSRRCFFWRTRRSLIISLYSSIWSPTSRKSEKSLSSTDSISEICRVVGGWLVFERGLSAVGRFVWRRSSSLSTTCSSSCSDDDMNPSVASVVLGKFCRERVPGLHKKDDETKSSYQREHLLRSTTVLPDHVRRGVQIWSNSSVN